MKHSLWEQRESDIVYLTNKILDDAQYEYDLLEEGTVKPRILNRDKSLELILSSNKSFVRTSDGEIKIMMGMDQPFQKYDVSLAEGLRKLFTEPSDELLVGMDGDYYIPGVRRDYSTFYRRYAYDYRQYYKKIFDKDTTYIDTTLTSYQFGKHDDKKVISRYNRWKEAFKNKKIVIVCGKGILDKLEYDIFEFAETKQYIFGPSKNAWSEHDDIMNTIEEEVEKDQLLIFILGMAGKVMISELTKKGYVCWDVGHLAKYYDAFMKGMDNSEENTRKFYAPD